jgi:TatD DNase family protein
MWIDAHAHLNDLDGQALTAAVAKANEAGIDRIINTGTSIDTSRQVLRQSTEHSLLSAAVGISPFDAGNPPEDWQASLESMLKDPAVVAIGETGIDSTNPTYPDIATQIEVFEAQLHVAISRDLPTIIHSRGYEIKACEMCCAKGVKKAMFHCFTGDIAALKKILAAGYYVSFSGIITFKSSPLVECVKYAPLSRMFIETDSPYLAPVPHRGKTNEPAWVGLVGNKVAEIKKINAVDVAEALRVNFFTLFGLI